MPLFLGNPSNAFPTYAVQLPPGYREGNVISLAHVGGNPSLGDNTFHPGAQVRIEKRLCRSQRRASSAACASARSSFVSSAKATSVTFFSPNWPKSDEG